MGKEHVKRGRERERRQTGENFLNAENCSLISVFFNPFIDDLSKKDFFISPGVFILSASIFHFGSKV